MFARGPRVQFVVVGVQKAGTTALFHFLAKHPKVTVPDLKELHFFDDDRRCWNAPAYGEYHRKFPWRWGGLRGEATPSYIWWPQALERLAAYNPRMRIIVIFRDPVMRAHAHWRMTRERGYETLDFSTAIRSGRNRMAGVAPDDQAIRRFSYVERGFYGAQSARLLSLFPREQVLMLRQEDLSSDHDSTLRRVFDFLGLPDHRIAQERVFEGTFRAPLAAADADLLADIYADDMARFEHLTGLDISVWTRLKHRRGTEKMPPADGSITLARKAATG
ncbi:sulfotransferase family protein [Xanthobacter sp. AM11]|uniref:sulfotransferase family protein n=1 Tax=Xanthobacter sp. AM11 TaxID=3380643 RepID=UPI0039BF8A1A